MDGWRGGWMDGWMDGWIDGWVDRWRSKETGAADVFFSFLFFPLFAVRVSVRSWMISRLLTDTPA